MIFSNRWDYLEDMLTVFNQPATKNYNFLSTVCLIIKCIKVINMSFFYGLITIFLYLFNYLFLKLSFFSGNSFKTY